MGASARWSNGRNGREGVGGGAVGGVGGEKQSREVGDGHKGRFVITKNSRDLSVNKQQLLNQSSNGKVPNMKVVQLFKIYNFDVVQKFI